MKVWLSKFYCYIGKSWREETPLFYIDVQIFNDMPRYTNPLTYKNRWKRLYLAIGLRTKELLIEIPFYKLPDLIPKVKK